MDNKKAITGFLGFALLAGAGYLLWKNYGKKPTEPKPEEKPAEKVAPKMTTDSLGKPIPVSPVIKAPTPKVVTADSILAADPKMILGKPLIAKFNGAGIYDTILKKVGVTVQGKTLGKAFKAEPTGSGSYQLKYKDENGNYRIINSVSVNTLA